MIISGVGWLFLIPLDQYSRHTYVSENALLPGQVHTYFGGSEHTVFRAYRHEVNNLAAHAPHEAAIGIEHIFKTQGLKTARQSYNFSCIGQSISGENAYALLQGPRADATEAMVLMAGLKNMEGQINYSGVALILTMARYFKRWSLWSKDILFVITSDSMAGPQAWVSAYHSQHDPTTTAPLPVKAGALQGAIALDYPASPAGHRFDKLHIHYDGTNGQLPNLDLLNTLVTIARNQVGITSSIQGMHDHDDGYSNRLLTIVRSILSQGAGAVTGPHSAFMPFHVDAVTLETVGAGWHDEMSLGMVVESGIRSINNLLEKLHQSFFFYILLGSERFVSIGTYLPSAMLLAGSFTITSVALWMQSGKPLSQDDPKPSDPVQRSINRERARSRAQSIAKGEKPEEFTEKLEYMGSVTIIPQALLQAEERTVAFPIAVVALVHFLGLIPLYLLNGASEKVYFATCLQRDLSANAVQTLLPSFILTHMLSITLPITISYLLTWVTRNSEQTLNLVLCFSLLILGITLATLSTLNFSLSLIVGLCASPLNFISPLTSSSSSTFSTTNGAKGSPKRTNGQVAITTAMLAAIMLIAPTTTATAIAAYTGKRGGLDGVLFGLEDLLRHANFAWHVNGTWTAVVVWLVWWPAWTVGASVVLSRYRQAGR